MEIQKEYIPYLAGLISYVILFTLKKAGKLKRFDKYLWSPFVVAFAGVCLGVIMVQYSPLLEKSTITSLVGMLRSMDSFVTGIIVFSQLLWISLIFQILAIKYNKKSFLTTAIVFVWLSLPILFYILGADLSGFKS